MALSRANESSQRNRLAQSLASGGNSDLSAAALTAAGLVEAFQGGRGFRHSMLRSRRRGDGEGERALGTMRMMGVNMEEIMLMEAMRRSLVDEAEMNASSAALAVPEERNVGNTTTESLAPRTVESLQSGGETAAERSASILPSVVDESRE
jgi:hypothetical protein